MNIITLLSSDGMTYMIARISLANAFVFLLNAIIDIIVILHDTDTQLRYYQFNLLFVIKNKSPIAMVVVHKNRVVDFEAISYNTETYSMIHTAIENAINHIDDATIEIEYVGTYSDIILAIRDMITYWLSIGHKTQHPDIILRKLYSDAPDDYVCISKYYNSLIRHMLKLH